MLPIESYKLYGRVNKALQITGGILGSTAVLAIVPFIPVFLPVPLSPRQLRKDWI